MNNVIQGTVRELEQRYKALSDEAIIREIRTGNHAGEALFYLLFGRYAGMLEMIYNVQPLTLMDFDDFMLELDICLFKNECGAIQQFLPGKASFKTYLSAIAHNLLYDLRDKELPTLDILTIWNTLHDNDNVMEVMLLVDEINNYPNKNARYVLLKTIEGYKSKEIAVMLTKRRHEEGTLDESEELKPSYIDTLRSRALKTIRKRILEHDKQFYADSCPACSPQQAQVHSGLYNSVVEASIAYSMQPAEPLSVKVGLFINNIMNLYNQIMEESSLK